jgi:hypothetical protein
MGTEEAKYRASVRKHHYRVYPPSARARTFVDRSKAIAFAQLAYVHQGLGNNEPVTISIGSGTTYREIGSYGPHGWIENEK